MPKSPASLLRKVPWSFFEPTPQSPAELIDAACAYAEDIDMQDPRAALSQVLPFTDVLLMYEYAIEDSTGRWEHMEAEVRVVATPHARLAGADLLWELCVSWASTVSDELDHHYFEGLILEEEGSDGLPPRYRVLLGS